MDEKKQYNHGQIAFGNIQLVLNESDLNSLVSNFLKAWLPEPHFIKVRVIGIVKNEIRTISLAGLQIKSSGIYLKLNCQWHASGQRQIPSFIFSGTLQIHARIHLQLKDNLHPDFQMKILDFFWKAPPQVKVSIFSISSKRVITKLLESRIPDLEAKILASFIEKLSLKNWISAQLRSNLPFQLSENRFVTISGGEVRYGNIQYSKSLITLAADCTLYWGVKEDDLSILTKDSMHFIYTSTPFIKTEMRIPLSLINALVPVIIPNVNKEIQKSKLAVKDLEISTDAIYLKFKVYLEGIIEDHLKINMLIRLDPDRQMLLLKDFQMEQIPDTSLLLKGMLFLFKGKVERMVFDYFPIHIESRLKQLEQQLKTFEISGIQPKMEGLNLKEFKLDVSNMYLCFLQKTTLKMNESKVLELF